MQRAEKHVGGPMRPCARPRASHQSIASKGGREERGKKNRKRNENAPGGRNGESCVDKKKLLR